LVLDFNRRPNRQTNKYEGEHIMKLVKICAVAALSAPAAAFAASAFDGTWKFGIDHIQPSKKPMILALNKDEFACPSCTFEPTVKPDGAEHPIKGDPNVDSGSVSVSDALVTLTLKLGGKTVEAIKYQVAADGKTVEIEDTSMYGAEPTVYKQRDTRVGEATPGAHALSGSWRLTKMLSVTGPGAMMTYDMTEGGFTWSSNGQSYDAKFDDKTYPVKGDPTKTMVNVKKISDTEVIETDSQLGKTVETYDMKVSADGKSLHVVDTVAHGHRVSQYSMTKMP
jgi:hypothetical protein